MTLFHVKTKVPQGNVNTAISTESIGTEGCGTCVGIIVVDNQNFKVCGHIDCAILDNGDMNVVRSKAERILAERFPLPINTVRVGYCTTSNGNSTSAIIQVINARYGKKVTLSSRDKDGIVSSTSGNLKLINFADRIPTMVSINNQLAEIS